MTNEANNATLRAAVFADDAAYALKELARELRKIGTDEARQHADEATRAARIARQWRTELSRQGAGVKA